MAAEDIDTIFSAHDSLTSQPDRTNFFAYISPPLPLQIWP